MEKIKDILSNLGLSEKEINLYLTSLRIGPSTAANLGQRFNISRSTSSYNCQLLVDKGFMEITPKGSYNLYSAVSPSKIISLLNKESQIIDKKIDKLRKVMPDFEKLEYKNAQKPEVKFYTGIDEIINIISEHARKKTDTLEFSAHAKLVQKFPDHMEGINDLHMKSRKNNVNYAIDIPENKEYNKMDVKKFNNLKFKYYKSKGLDINTHIQIDGDEVLLISMENDYPIAIDIKHKGIAKDLSIIFKEVWKNLERE